jgi:hypothetical protein
MLNTLARPTALVTLLRGSRLTRRVGALGLLVVTLALAGIAPAVATADVPSTPALTYGTNGDVYSIATLGDTTYLGGSFSQIGLATGGGAVLAAADGQADASMPAVSGSSHQVEVAVADGSGGWYIGGNFTHVGGLVRNNIAHVLADGSVDPSFNPNATDGVYGLALSGSTLYASGYFNGASSIGGANRNYIAALDASTGNATSWDPNANDVVFTLAVSGDGSTVYAGGFFNGTNSIGGATRNHIAALDATTGVATSWDPNANGSVATLAVSGSTVYAGGNFNGASSIGGATRDHIAALDATTGLADPGWDPNANGFVGALAVSGSTVYAGGQFSGASSIGGATRNYIAALDATTGNATSFDPNADNPVFALAVSGSTVYAGGAFSGTSSIGGADRNHLAALDATTGIATSWDPNADNDGYALAVSGSTVYAGGAFSLVNQVPRNNLAALDAGTGQPTSWDPNADGTVRTLAGSGSTVYAGGNFSTIGGQTRSSIAALDATSGLATDWNPNANGQVSALALSGSTVYAGGSFDTIGGATRNYIAALDANTNTNNATAWDPNATCCVSALAVDGSTVYAGGDFNGTNSIGGADRNYIAALDANTDTNNATAWDPNADSSVYALAVDGSTVYAGGPFNTIGGDARNYIAALDANTNTNNATARDPNANGTVLALAVSGSTVYAGGDFNGPSSIGGANRNYLAALDATTGSAASWNPGANNEVDALVASPGVVYAGGMFNAIETGSGAHFAMFVEAPASVTLPSISGTPAAGHSLTCANGTWSGATPQTYSYQWLRDNVAISGQTSTTYSVQAGDAGHVIKCRVTASNLGGSASATSAGKTILTPPHNTTLPSVSGTPVTGHTLTCNKGTWSGSIPRTYSYHWLRDNVGIIGATSATYLTKASDAGHAVKCRVTASNGAGSATATSAAVTIKAPPRNTVAPKITGTPKVGHTLTCSKGTWTGTAPITYGYRWLRDGTAIVGATSATYNVAIADKGHALRCKVTAHNAAGTASKLSAAVNVT